MKELVKTHNFFVTSGDTDSIAFCKRDKSPFTKKEQEDLLKELNSLMFENFTWEHDGHYKKQICLAAKNYIMLTEDNKVKLKGSSLKSATLEPALKAFIKEIIDSMLNDRTDFVDIYHKYIKEASDIKDIKPWASKRTISERTLESERTNEEKVRTAIAGSEYVEGDKVYVFFDEDDSLKLVEDFNGSYNRDRMYEKLYKVTDRFSSVLDRKMFINYKLKRSKALLDNLLKT